MHVINPETESKYRIVQCQDPMCNICTSTVLDGCEVSPSPPSPGIAVYTCSNPSCSLCDGDYSLLLDIIHPTVTPQEDWILVQDQRNKNRPMTSPLALQMQTPFALKRENKSQEINIESSMGRAKRKLSSHVMGHAAKLSRRQSRDIGDDLINNVDDNQLMNLAMELELDKIDCLPDLQTDIITELAI